MENNLPIGKNTDESSFVTEHPLSSAVPSNTQETSVPFPIDPYTYKVLVDLIKANSTQVFPKVSSGNTSIPSNNGTSPHQVAHGLGVTPNFVSVSGDSAITGNSTNPGGTIYLDPGAAADATYLYIFNSCQSAVVLSLPCQWYAAYIPTS